jgi:glyoxylase-like metal-dependent hydrolase (beta-lactamase superfamily II)
MRAKGTLVIYRKNMHPTRSQQVMEIIPNLHHISLRGVNAYLVLGSTLTLVDTGMAGSQDQILGYIQRLGYAPVDLTRIILTHYHLDHAGSLAALRERTGAQVLAHQADIPFISGEQNPPAQKGGIVGFLTQKFAPVSLADPSPVDIPLEDGVRLDLLDGANVIHAPGHTPGSIVLHFPGERLLITGDVITRRGRRLNTSFKVFSHDPAQARESIRRLAPLEVEVLCPGHGKPLMHDASAQVRALLPN